MAGFGRDTPKIKEDNSEKKGISDLAEPIKVDGATAQEEAAGQSLDPDLAIQYSDQEDAAQSVAQSNLNEAELADLGIDQSEVDAATQGAIVGSITGASRNERERQRKLRKLAEAETGRKVAGGRRKKARIQRKVFTNRRSKHI